MFLFIIYVYCAYYCGSNIYSKFGLCTVKESNKSSLRSSTRMVADQTISVIFVELALFTKTLEECVTESDRLFYIFRNSGGFQKIPEWIEEAGEISRRLAEACEVAAFDKEKKLKYEIDKMNERNILAQLVFAERKGFETGYADGEAKGLADGTAERILALK